MTGVRSGDAICTSCGIRLCLGPTPRIIVYPMLLLVAGIFALWVWLIGDVTFLKLAILILVPLLGVIPFSLWMACRVRGVIVSPRNTPSDG